MDVTTLFLCSLIPIFLPLGIRLVRWLVTYIPEIPERADRCLQRLFPPRFESFRMDLATFQYWERERLHSAFPM